jgi:membrane fusion protein, multidrug efflux system
MNSHEVLPAGALATVPAPLDLRTRKIGWLGRAIAGLGERLPRSSNALLASSLAVVVATAGALYIAAPARSVSTDAAYLAADASNVAPRVRGLLAEVLVRDHQRVTRGDALVRIDSEEFDARVAAAEADLQSARATVQAAEAAILSLHAEEELAAAHVRAAAATIRSADAQSERARVDRQRYDRMVASGAAALRDADQVRAPAVSAASDAERSRAELDVSRHQADVIRAKRATLDASLAQAEAMVARAAAALNLAQQDREHTIVRAPIDGVVGNRHADLGDYVAPGTRLMTIVPLDALYVTANFKETQTARMIPGQRATIEVDALPGQTFAGEVESFAPGSGSQFSLLPFEPGTGNFTKIVQRVPVRIRLDPDQPGVDRLRPGLSTTVEVELTDDRP